MNREPDAREKRHQTAPNDVPDCSAAVQIIAGGGPNAYNSSGVGTRLKDEDYHGAMQSSLQALSYFGWIIGCVPIVLAQPSTL